VLPNTTCKLSGLVTEADWHGWKVADLGPCADIALDAFGPARTMFGSLSRAPSPAQLRAALGRA
jgi:predicted TIM-barrel fold metal-dependent hydrolase